MMKIGISARNIIIDQKKKKFINQTYLDFIRQLDLIPFLIFDKKSLEEIGYLLDGFMIIGGDDINPLLYQQENKASYNVDQEIDELDFAILDYAKRSNKPVLGICRGLQVINVYFQGSLKQDIDAIHQNKKNALLKVENSLYFPFLNKQTISINSYHHQGIDKIGDNLLPSGISDGIIELIEHQKYPFIGVQFHPELMEDKGKIFFLVFIRLMEKEYARSTNQKNYRK